MKFKLKFVVASALLAVGLMANAQTVIKFSHVVAADTPKGKAAVFFAQKAAELTKGKV
jgi:C4-dicarboxylate-binding protein DctP